MDLEAYIGRYSGETRLKRLLLIARTSLDEDVSGQAFLLAEQQMKADGNVRRYREVFGYDHHRHQQQQQEQRRQESCQQQGRMHTEQQDIGMHQQQQYSLARPYYRHPKAGYDIEWVEMTEARNKQARSNLQGRLSTAQSQLHKEAIRTAYVALAQHDAKTGELREAMSSLLRATDYCTSRSQTAHISLMVLELALALENFSQVREYVKKVEHTLGSAATATPASPIAGGGGGASSAMNAASSPGGAGMGGGASSSSSSQNVTTKLKIASGLESLAQGNYESAARILTALITSTSSTSWEWQSVVCPEDIALYAAILSLATQDRSTICELADHPDGLELVPMMRELLVQFTRAKYYACCTSFNPILAESSSGRTVISAADAGTDASSTGTSVGNNHTSSSSSSMVSPPTLSILPFQDLYLEKHWPTLCTMIREKCVMEYLKPYQCVRLDIMAQQLPLENLQDVLVDLIGRGLVPKARVDARKGLLTKSPLSTTSIHNNSSSKQSQKQVCRKLAKLEQRVLDDSYAMLIRLACLEHDIKVLDDNSGNPPPGVMDSRGGRRLRGDVGGRGRYLEDPNRRGIDDSSSDEEGDTPMLDVGGGDMYAANPEDLY